MSRFLLCVLWLIPLRSSAVELWWPLESESPVTCDFCGYRGYSGGCHGGIDIRARGAVLVVAAAAGEVIRVATGLGNTYNQEYDPNIAYGNHVRIRHSDNSVTIYAHLATVDVRVGNGVEAGERLGTSDNSGYSSAPHLHFEVRSPTGQRLDPYGDRADRTACYTAISPECGPDPLWATCPPQPWSGVAVDADSDGYTVAEGDCMDEGETLEGVPAAAVHPGAEEVCNYTDDDCDGTIDEGFAGIGESCFVGVGACRREGTMVCTADFTGIACSIGPGIPSAEICNGEDDDCDGETDEGAIACPVGMTSVNLCFCMDSYEASRENATADRADWPGFGAADTGDPQSVAGVLPWQMVTWGGAVAACERVGKRLCLASEWRTACAGEFDWGYPYGPEYNPEICNGWEDSIADLASTGSFAECVTPTGIFDMSGNVWEWVEHDLREITDMGTIGASYVDNSNLALLGCTVMPFPVTDPACASETVEIDGGTGFPVCGSVSHNTGFRCCFSP